MKKDKLVSDVLGEEHAMTPSEVCNRRFRRVAMGGYDVHEVDAYLQRVADALERLINQVKQLKERIQEQSVQLDRFREMEAALRSALASSQKFAQDIVDAAKREADALIEQARLEKARARHEALQLPDSLAGDIRRLKGQRERLRAELLAVLEAHKCLLDQLPLKEDHE